MPLVHLIFRLPSKLRRRARRSRVALMLLLFALCCTLIAPFYIIYKPPNFVIRYFQYKWPDVLWQVNTSQKMVALTIDDAPSEHTDFILEALKANDATATFFTIGSQIDGREASLRRLLVHGNELGNHAMHDEPSRSLSDADLAEQIRTVHAKLDAVYSDLALPERKLYFRPGSGFFSQRMLRNVAGLGYRLVLGSVYPHDPQIKDWHRNANHILSMVRPGAIIICHDRRPHTFPMLLKVLPELQKRGYSVVTLTELLEAAQPH